MPFLVGLTGGIGSGKSAAAELFRALGASVVDTDVIAHALTAPGGEAIPAIRERFGDAVVAPDGRLDRAQMRTLAFADPDARRALESILHPMIRTRSTREIAAATGPYVILVVPLLVESAGYRDRVDRVLVVDCAPETQIQRTMSRSGLTRDAVLGILAAQASRDARLAAADDVIDNDGPREGLGPQVAALHRRYLAFAASAT
ncbi:MAG: dephospho-CoA kinase [Burkholderiales bacterium]